MLRLTSLKAAPSLTLTLGLRYENFGQPANANLAPPGPYLLFLLNKSGVPSVAKIVTLQ